MTALWVKLLVDGVLLGDRGRIVVAALGVGGSQALLWLGVYVNFTLSLRMDELTGHLLQRRLVGAILRPAGIAHQEDSATLEKIERLRSRADELGSAGGVVENNLGTLVSLVGFAVLLTTVDPLLLLLPVLAVPSVLAANRGERLREKAWETTANERRLARSLFDVATTAGPGKEVRLFGLQRPVLQRHSAIWDDIEQDQVRIHRQAVSWAAAGALLFAVGYLAAVTLVALRLLRGQASPGDLILTFMLAGQVNTLTSGLIGALPRLMRTLTLVGLLVELEDVSRADDARHDMRPPERLREGITLHEVSFRYPGADTDVLSEVDLHLPAGAIVALVGDNGAGKSTLVKLLCALYSPTAGRITVDGADLARVAPAEWRTRTSAAFQDFVRFELQAGLSVGVGDLAHADDDDAIGAALRRAAAEDVVATLPSGLATPLGRSFEGGHEPSGGQWQKLAIARSMMRPPPLLLVLDEPTASLDAETEHRLFERYTAASRQVSGSHGGITVLVSHRFSTVRMADTIVVLHGGRVVEMGSHTELMRGGGLYAELYELQAMQYR